MYALFEQAARAAGDVDVAALARALDRLLDADDQLVDRHAEDILVAWVSTRWGLGWLPGELIRHAARADPRAARLVAAAVAADHARRDPAGLHPRWVVHVDALALPEVRRGPGWLAAFAAAEVLGRRPTLHTVAVAIAALQRAGLLTTIIPPPGAGQPSGVHDLTTAPDSPVLQKVRALLAQAESTTFEAEAAAFTAKAQELMARHAIDAAILWAGSERTERPSTIRLPIDDPYADAKALLLHFVARHSRCRAIREGSCGLATVVGFASDLAATELLFTSLLVQSQTALLAEAAGAHAGARTRSRRFRSSFLLAFSYRIDQRLAEVNAAVQHGADDEHGAALLPVLAARDGAVDEAVEQLFGDLTTDRIGGGSDPLGWARGQAAADLARLNNGDLPARRGDAGGTQLRLAAGE